MTNPLATVIIPAWQGRPYITECLSAVLAQSYKPIEIIVVDNASTDGTAEFVTAQFPSVRLLKNKHNLGFSGGCNTGLKVARGDVLALLNQDTSVSSDWLQQMCAALENPAIGVVGCKILYPDRHTIQHAGGWLAWPLGLAHHYGHGEPDTGQWNMPKPVEFVSGAAMAFRRDVFNTVGLLDEGFWPGYFEDVDYCLRIRQAGYEVWYVPDAQLTHLETTSITDDHLVSEAYQRGRLRFLLKHTPPDKFLAEFIPAEGEYQLPAILGRESHPLRMAYLEALINVGEILQTRWNANADTIKTVAMALRNLQHQAWTNDWVKVEKTIPPVKTDDPQRLKEIQFHSQLPVFGLLITRFRELWYSVAARWAIRNLMAQQEIINHTNRHFIQALHRELSDLAEENSRLSQEISTLRTKLKK